jgi:polysaccharide export outer membrane protein
MLKKFAALCAAAALTACSTIDGLEALAEPEAAPYRLGPGDEVRIDVYRLAEMSNSYTVGDTGAISLPIIQSKKAEGLTVEALESEIEQSIAAMNLIRDPSVTVQVAKYRPFFIIGEVSKPGSYSFVPNMTVLTAMSIAGGPTYRANSDTVVITRTVDGKTITGKAKSNSRVLPGDTIRVKEGWF